MWRDLDSNDVETAAYLAREAEEPWDERPTRDEYAHDCPHCRGAVQKGLCPFCR